MDITATIKLSDYSVACLLCSAMEGGSNYWAKLEEKCNGRGEADHAVENSFGEFSIAYPFRREGYLIFSAPREDGPGYDSHDGKDRFKLDRAAIEAGTQIMANKYPYHFSNLINGNDDAVTGDVWLQCCLFGEIVYG